MEHKNAGSDASEVAEGNKISSVLSPEAPAQRPATSISIQGWKPPAHQQSSGDKPSPPQFNSAPAGLSSAASSALFGFASSSNPPGLFQFPPLQPSPPASGSNPPPVSPSFGGSAPASGCCTTSATGGAAASAQAFGCSSATAFGCSQQPLFATADEATRMAGPFSFTINGPGVPAGFFNGFNQFPCRAVSGCTQPWGANSLPPNAKIRCYCGKVAGVRFSNTTDGSIGLFYCCPDYNEEAVRNGTQERNYCTFTQCSGGFSPVRKCYCGKVAVLQKSEKFGTWGKLFYSCPEYREKEVVFGRRCSRGHCSYIEWCSSSPAPAPVQLFG